MLAAGGTNYSELKNFIVWAKDNGGMGAFYRSRHELIFAFKNGSAPHINSFELGQHGRYRTNVWEYGGVNTFKTGRQDELARHPTVEPVAVIADAIKNVSRRGGIVLDLFGGSGSTLIAAHKTGRRARVCELDPSYCDRMLRRVFAKDDAGLVACGWAGRETGREATEDRSGDCRGAIHTGPGRRQRPRQAGAGRAAWALDRTNEGIRPAIAARPAAVRRRMTPQWQTSANSA